MLVGVTNALSDIVAEQEVTISNLQEKASKSMAGVLEGLSDPLIKNLQEYLQGVTNRQDDLLAEATNMINELDTALANWTRYDMQVYTNYDGDVTNVVFSEATSNELVKAIEEAEGLVKEARALSEAAFNEYMDERNTLDFWQTLQAAGGDYAWFTNQWWGKVATAEGLYANLTNRENAAKAEYDYMINLIKERYDVVVEGLTMTTNSLAEELSVTNAVYYYLVTNDLVAATNAIAKYNGETGYIDWLKEEYGVDYPEGDTAERQIEFQTFKEDLLKAKAAIEEEIAKYEDSIDALTEKKAEVTEILDTVIANGKDDPSKWTGKAKEVAEKAKERYDATIAKLAERKAVVLANIERFKSEIEEGRTLKISVDDVEKQEAKVLFVQTNTLANAIEALNDAEDALWEAREMLDDPVWIIDNFSWTLYNLVGEFPYAPGFEAAYEDVYAKWLNVLSDSEQNIVGAKVLLAALEEVLEKRKNQR